MNAFLNGVCRHERNSKDIDCPPVFLNGVCRHELTGELSAAQVAFLNGVCRHERHIHIWVCGVVFSKWRMPP